MNKTAETLAAEKAFARVCSAGAAASADFCMLQPGDRVLAALSGGMDSMVMLETLLYLQKKAPFEFEIAAVTFDPLFPGFNSQSIADYCRTRNVEHHIVRVDIPQALAGKCANERTRRPCVRCSRLRRGMLCSLARELDCSKLALGHHADDLMESFFISLVRGQGLTTMAPNVLADKKNQGSRELRIIRPLAMVRESVVKCAAGCFEFPAAGECMYKAELDASGDRAWAKAQIKVWQERIPDLGTLMLKSMGRVEAEWLLDKRYLDFTEN